MPLAEEQAIQLIPYDFTYADENVQIPETPLFEWADSGAKFAQGASVLGQVRIGLTVTGWNACSTNSAGSGGRGLANVMY